MPVTLPGIPSEDGKWSTMGDPIFLEFSWKRMQRDVHDLLESHVPLPTFRVFSLHVVLHVSSRE